MAVSDYALDFSPIQKGLQSGLQMKLEKDANDRAQQEHDVKMQQANMDISDRKAQTDALGQANQIIQDNLMQPVTDPNNPDAPPTYKLKDGLTPDDYQSAFNKAVPAYAKFYAASRDAKGMAGMTAAAEQGTMLDQQRKTLGLWTKVQQDPSGAIPDIADYYNKHDPSGIKIDPSTVTFDDKSGVYNGKGMDANGQPIPVQIPKGYVDAHLIQASLNPLVAMQTLQTARTQAAQEGRAATNFGLELPGKQLSANVATAEQPQAGAIAAANVQDATLKPQETQARIGLQGAQAVDARAGANFHNAYAGYLGSARTEKDAANADLSTQRAAQSSQQRAISAVFPGGKVPDATDKKDQAEAAMLVGSVSSALKDPANQGAADSEVGAAVRLVHTPIDKMDPNVLKGLNIAPDGTSVAVKRGSRWVNVPVDQGVGARLLLEQQRKQKRGGLMGSGYSTGR